MIMADFFGITSCGRTEYGPNKKFGVVDNHNQLMAFSEGYKNVENRYDAVVEHVDKITFAPIDHNKAYENTCVANERKCDFFLYTDSRRTLIFAELKDKYTAAYIGTEELKLFLDQHASVTEKEVAEDAWIDDVINQLTDTIKKFKKLNPTDFAQYPNIHRAYGANRKVGYGVDYPVVDKKEDFYLDTQCELILSNLIKIEGESPPQIPQVLKLSELKRMTE